MSMGRRKVRGMAEDDAFTSWRHVMCYLARAGARGKIKRHARRRDRHQARHALTRGRD